MYAEDRLAPAFVAQDEAFRNTLQSSWPGPVAFNTEYLEFLRRPGEVEEKLMLELLERKYESRRPDLVVTSTSVGLEFLLSAPGASLRGHPDRVHVRPSGAGGPAHHSAGRHGHLAVGRLGGHARRGAPSAAANPPGARRGRGLESRRDLDGECPHPAGALPEQGGDPVHVSGDARAGAPDGGGAAGRRHRAGQHLSPGFRGQGLRVPGGGREDRPGIAGSSLRRARDPRRCWSGGRPRAQSRPRRREGGPPRAASAGR